eukprot:TRINITY_DN5809_c0_g1_i4.p2 TRINITY_DN5809_c0_g1~~TRINITY_DN5809_c0_g1_i4.p2  ORF type:complete len:161 (-),score=60.54 TRINITY_DN5809_c0_g1_i4:85-567(-)
MCIRDSTSTLLALAGLLAILGNKATLGKSLIPQSPHAWLGTFALVLVVMQGTVGVLKLVNAQKGAQVHAWHGAIGPAIALLFTAAASTGIGKSEMDSAASAGLASVSSVLLLTILVIRVRHQFMKTQEYGELTTEERQFQRAYGGGGSKGSNAAEYGDDL